MRIHLLSYVRPEEGRGGGEAIMRALIHTGEVRGHHFKRTHLLPRPVFDPLHDVHVALLADVWNQPGHRKRLDRRLRAISRWSAQGRYRQRVRQAMQQAYVHIDNAYVDICDLPYLPCNGEARGGICPFKSGLDRRCFALRNRSMYERSLANWFLSPLHRDVVERRLEAEEHLPKAEICRPLIDPAPFRAARAASDERPIQRLYVGPVTEAKGLTEVMRRYDPADIHVVGERPSSRYRRRGLPKFGSWKPPVDPEAMPGLLASAREVLFLPRWPEPQGRVALEASLAGCRVVSNGRVGAFSFPEEPQDDRLYKGAADEFWMRLEQSVPSTEG